MSTDDRGGDDETSPRTEAEIRAIVADELRAQQSNSTRRGVLKALGLGGAAAALGGTAGAQTGGGGGGASLDVGAVTQNTYRIAGNRYGGPAAARSELNSELGSSDAGARFAADDTGAEYYWTGSDWEQLPVEAPAINTEDATITDPSRISTDYVAGSPDYPTIQDAVDALPDKDSDARFTGMSVGDIAVPPLPSDRDETVDVNQKHTSLIGGAGQNVVIETDSNDHVIDVSQNDVYIANIGVSHRGSGDHDGILAAGSGIDELVLYRATCDWAPRYGFNIEIPHSHLLGVEATGGDEAALRLASKYARCRDTKIQQPPSDGAILDNSYIRFDGVVEGAGGDGVRAINRGGSERVDVTVENCAGHGVLIDGAPSGGSLSGSKFDIEAWDNGGDDVRVGQADANYIYVNANGTVTLESDSENNTVVGFCASNGLTDNGTNNDTSGLRQIR